MRKTANKFKHRLVVLSFILPALVLYCFFVIYPLLNSIRFSFFRMNPMRGHFHFIGIQNYVTLFTDDPHFIRAVSFTFRYAIIMVVVINVVALLLAVKIESGIKGRGIVRNMFFIPNVMSVVIVAFVWGFIFTALYPSIVGMLDIPFLDIVWFATPQTAFWVIVIVSFWQALGFHIIIFIAGLQVVPSELYEAAEVDGATPFKKMMRVTIPLLAPTITISLFLSIAGTLRLFDAPLALTGGGPMRSTESIVYNIYNTAFVSNELGLASAKSVFLLVLIAIVAFLQIRFTSSKEVSM